MKNTFNFMEVLHMNAYIERIIDSVKKRDASASEFIQTVEEYFRANDRKTPRI